MQIRKTCYQIGSKGRQFKTVAVAYTCNLKKVLAKSEVPGIGKNFLIQLKKKETVKKIRNITALLLTRVLGKWIRTKKTKGIQRFMNLKV